MGIQPYIIIIIVSYILRAVFAYIYDPHLTEYAIRQASENRQQRH